MSRGRFLGKVVSLPSSDGGPEVGRKSTVSSPGAGPASAGTETPHRFSARPLLLKAVLGPASHRIKQGGGGGIQMLVRVSKK